MINKETFQFHFWLAVRLLRSGKTRILSPAGWISLAGLVVGVASLVVSMAAISGYESTLMKSVSDVAGHIQIFRAPHEKTSWKDLFEKIKKHQPSVQAAHRFVMIEGVLAYRGKVSGVVLQGVDQDQVQEVLGIQNRLVQGQFQLNKVDDEISSVLIGKGMAKSYQMNVGDEIRMIVPVNHDLEVTQFHRRVGRFKIAGILDLGKYDYDQRWMFSDLATAQKLADIGDTYSGLQLKLEKIKDAQDISLQLSKQLGSDYRVKSWHDINGNLFEAVKIEKVIIFFVIFIIVIAAAFNVASSLYVNVIQSYPQIAMLKAIGLDQKGLIRVFSYQGLILGAVGSLFGFILGLLFCVGFLFLQKQFGIIQGSVYKVDFIYVDVRFLDILITLFSTILVCFIATFAPAQRGARLTTIEGLKGE